MFEKTDAVYCNEVLTNHMQIQSYLQKFEWKRKSEPNVWRHFLLN